MISGIDPSSEQFLNDLARAQARSESAQQRISSGVKVSVPSDAPGDIADILQLSTDIQRNQQTIANFGRIKTEVDGAEGALNSAVQLMDRASVLASQGTGPMQDAGTRTELAQEVDGLLQQMVAISATVVEGRYVFSGDQDQNPAYAINYNSADGNGVDRLLTTQSVTRLVEDSSGTRFPVAHTAQDIFDHRNADDSLAPDNVFAALNGLRTALLNNDATAIANSISALQTAGKYLNLQLGFYGATQARVASATEASQNAGLTFKSELSGKRDADMTEAILELTQSQTQIQASLQARAKVPRTSLFDYLA